MRHHISTLVIGLLFAANALNSRMSSAVRYFAYNKEIIYVIICISIKLYDFSVP